VTKQKEKEKVTEQKEKRKGGKKSDGGPVLGLASG